MTKTNYPNRLKNICLIVGVFLLLSTGCEKSKSDSAKIIEVEGWVTDSADKKAIPGASIVVAGLQRGTSTNSDGHFKITSPDTASLIVSFDGFDTQVRALKGVATQMIALKANPTPMKADLLK